MDDTFLQFILRNAGTLCQQFAATVSTVRIHCHLIHFIHLERSTVRHSENGYFLTGRLGHIHCVGNTCRRIEIEAEILERSSVRSAFATLLPEEKDMIVRRLHPIGPQTIGHLQSITYFFSRQAHGVKHIFVLIQIEHVAHENVSFADFRVIGQGSCKRNIRSADCQLQFMDKVNESGRTEISRTCGYGLG